MATDAPSATLTDAELVYQYFGKLLAKGGRQEPVDRLLAELAEYFRELERVRALIREAEESSARGESGQLDVEDVIRRGRERMATENITD
jgi:hypothetical protein